MPDVPLICPLCSEALAAEDVATHNAEHHDGNGLVPPSSLPENTNE